MLEPSSMERPLGARRQSSLTAASPGAAEITLVDSPAEEWLDLAIRDTDDGFWNWDLTRDRIELSPRLREMLGERASAFEDAWRWFASVLHPSDRRAAIAALQEHLDDRQPLDLDCRFRVAAAGYRWHHIRGRVIRDEAGAGIRMVGSVRDVEERKSSENRLRAHQRKLLALFHSALQSTWLLSPEGIVWEVNRTALDSLSIRETDVLGLPFWMTPWWTPSRSAPTQIEQAVHAAAVGNSIRAEIDVSSPIGQTRVLDLAIRPIFDEDDALTFLLAEARDVTERALAIRSARRQGESGDAVFEQPATDPSQTDERSWRRRPGAEFLANISHEIRTPMTAILGFTEILIQEGEAAKIPEERLGYLRTIQRNGEHLLELVNDILDLSKIDAGRLSVEVRPCDPALVIDDVLSLLRGRAQSKGLRLEFVPDGELPPRVRTDPTRLRQVLLNLVGNAVKFTEAGFVRLAARLRDDDGPSPLLEFEVVDTGIGIGDELLGRIFEPYAQADASTSRRYGGTGLGLAITKHLVEMLGGTIRVESRLGRGSKFVATIATGPLAKPGARSSGEEAGDPEHAARPAPAIPEGARLLLAEDGVDSQRLIAYHLRRAGAQVEIVENGHEAIESVLAARERGAPFDAVLMDMQMPVMDGYEATRRLRELGERTPILALTAHAMAGDRLKCLECGCDGYASKPIDRIALLSLVGQSVQRARGLPGGPATEEAVDA